MVQGLLELILCDSLLLEEKLANTDGHRTFYATLA